LGRNLCCNGNNYCKDSKPKAQSLLIAGGSTTDELHQLPSATQPPEKKRSLKRTVGISTEAGKALL